MSGVRRFGLDQLSAAAERLVVRGASALGPTRPNDAVVQIRILTVNDFHGALAPTGQVDGRPAGGAAYLAALLDQERALRPETTLLVHAGDMVGFTPPLSGLLQDEPTAAVLNRLGFAAGAVGIHEFDEGLDELVRLVDGGSHPTTIWRTGSFPGLNFPCLAANVLSERTGHPILPAVRVLSVGGVRVGVVGVVSTDAARHLGAIGRGLRFVDEAATVNRCVAELREHRVAAIIVLAHLGGVTTGDGTTLGGKLPAFAAALDSDVDVIVAGHTHQPTIAELSGVLTIQAHPHGLSYGSVDLWIDRRLNRVVERAAKLHPTWHDQIEPDLATTLLLASYERLATPVANAVILERRHPTVREAPPAAATSSDGLGRMVADAYRAATGADIAVVHPSELRADLPAGVITRGDLYRALPGGYDLLTVRLRGAAVARLVDDGGKGVRPARLACSGATLELDTERRTGRRIVSMRLSDGARLDPAATYTVALAAPTLGNVPGGDIRSSGKTIAALESYLRGQSRAVSADAKTFAEVLAAS